jgi:prephenate dehydratase
MNQPSPSSSSTQTAPVSVAYQGEPGAYSEAALLKHFQHPVTSYGKGNFEGVFEAVERGACTYGFIPIENSLAGSIHRNYDLLREHHLYIIGETTLRVQHCLIAMPGVQMEQIRLVTSHPQALDQCRGYLNRWKAVQVEPVYDTAGAVKDLAASGSRSTAAIASRRAAEIYGMQILAEGIEDNSANYTRFLVLSPEPVDPGENAKTSIMIALPDKPGSLFKALSVFALRDIDMAKLESRPLIGQPGQYLFYIDIAGSTREEHVARALSNLEEYASMLRVLGSYPRYHVW